VVFAAVVLSTSFAVEPVGFRLLGPRVDFLAPYELCQRFYDQGYISDELLEPKAESKPSDAGKVRSAAGLLRILN